MLQKSVYLSVCWSIRLSVLSYVPLSPVKFVKLFATRQHLTASGCFSYRHRYTCCLSNAMHGQNINLPVCVCVCLSGCLCVCPSHFLSTRLHVRPLNAYYSLITGGGITVLYNTLSVMVYVNTLLIFLRRNINSVPSGKSETILDIGQLYEK